MRSQPFAVPYVTGSRERFHILFNFESWKTFFFKYLTFFKFILHVEYDFVLRKAFNIILYSSKFNETFAVFIFKLVVGDALVNVEQPCLADVRYQLVG